MNLKAERARQLTALLARLGHESALVGGIAVSIRTRERFTKDIDFAVAVDSDAETEALARALQGKRYRLAKVIEQTDRGVLSTLRFRHPDDRGDEPTVNLLFASCGIEKEIVAAATAVSITSDVSVPAARIPHLIAMKTLSESNVRRQDGIDLQLLLTAASPAEFDEARAALLLIEKRGFHRGKDLQATLQSFVQQMQRPEGRR